MLCDAAIQVLKLESDKKPPWRQTIVFQLSCGRGIRDLPKVKGKTFVQSLAVDSFWQAGFAGPVCGSSDR